MRFDPLHPTHSAIVEVLAKEPGISVGDVHAKITKEHGIEVSTQNLYRIIAQMADTVILFRDKGRLFLSLNWLRHVANIVHDAEEVYTEDAPNRAFSLPKEEGEKKWYNAGSLAAMDPLWDHIVLKLSAHTSATEWYEYDSRPYHVLALPSAEIPFYSNLKAAGITHRMLIGNNTFLDVHGAKLLEGVVQTVVTDTPPFPKEGYILLICGEYIIEMILPSSLTEHFSAFYATTNTIEEFKPELYADIFNMKVPCKISIRKSEREAGILRAKFAPFFT